MMIVHPATGRNRIGFMRGHIALLTTGSAHLGECEYQQTQASQSAPRIAFRHLNFLCYSYTKSREPALRYFL
jgi:hypothetical protein